MQPLFSIGVTTYNRKAMLQECLRSILAQSEENFEVIVGNDFVSESLTAELLGVDDSRIRIINRPVNLGELNNMNALLSEATGKYFTWLADDDCYTPHFLKQMRLVLESKNFKFAFSEFSHGLEYKDQALGKDLKVEIYSGANYLLRYLNRQVHIIGCYGVYDREYLLSLGGIQKLGNGFSPYADNLLAIQAALENEVALIESPLVFFRTHPESISFTSLDIDSYLTAQTELMQKSVTVFTSESLVEDYSKFLFLLFRWCMTDFISVVLRDKSTSPLRAFAFFSVVRPYKIGLGIYRILLPALFVKNFIKLWLKRALT